MQKNKKEPEVQFIFVPWKKSPWMEIEKETLWNLILTALNRMAAAEIERHLKNIQEVHHEQKAVGRSS